VNNLRVALAQNKWLEEILGRFEEIDLPDSWLVAYRAGDQGQLRTETMLRGLQVFSLPTPVEEIAPLPADDTAAETAISGCDLIINCLDAGRIGMAFRVNRAALAKRVPRDRSGRG
jgi:hypothetical protein